MARPKKWRKIEFVPTVQFFVPSQTDMPGTPENILKIEELEAVRLKDMEGLEQEECAERMEVSRPTFQRILISAREKIADSLIHGKTLRIEGGNYTRNICPVKCRDCGREWSESFENLEAIRGGTYACPECGSKRVDCNRNCKGKFCSKNCWRYKKEQSEPCFGSDQKEKIPSLQEHNEDSPQKKNPSRNR